MRKANVRRGFRLLSVAGLLAAVSLLVLTTLASGTRGRIELSGEEIAWLKAHPVIRHAPDPDYAPFEFKDKTGHYVGIAPDFLKLVGEKLGVEFKAVPSASWAASLESVKRHKADLVTVATKTAKRSKYMIFTSPYIEFPNVILMREDVSGSFSIKTLEGKTIAAINGWAITTYIQKEYPKIKLYWVANVKAALEAVSNSIADAVLLNRATAGYWRAKTDIANLRIAGETAYIYKLSFASRKDWPQLSKLLEKGLNAISESERKEIIDRWIFPFERRWRPGPRFWIGLAGIVVLLLIAGFFAWNLSLQRKVQGRTRDLQTELVERKRAEEALRESEKKYKHLSNELEAILDHLPALIFYKDRKGNFIRVNKYVADAHHMQKEELASKSSFDLYTKDQAQTYLEDDLEVLESGEPKLFIEEPWETEEGKRWVSTSKIPFVDEHGDILGIIGISIDITKRKLAEEALRESEERYKLLVENQTDMIVKFDTDGRLIFVSPSYCKTFEKTQDELLGKKFMPLIHEEDREAVAKTLDKAHRPPYSGYVEERAMTKDGWRWQSWLNTAVLNEEKEVESFVAVGRDINERKLAEESLRESEERFRTVADFTHDWEYWIAPDGHHIYVSPSCEKITGYGPEAFVNDPGLLEKIVHPDDQLAVVSHISQAEQQGEPSSLVFRIITLSGEERWISHVCQSVYGTDGTCIGRRGSNRDISKHKQMEVHLQQATKMEAIATLAGGVAHEFNNALMGILGNIELLKMDLPKDERRDRYFGAMKGSSHRMSRLTDQLLAYAQGGKYQPRNLKLDDFVIETVPILQHDLSPTVRVETVFPKDISYIKADYAQMQMVLSAILANSNEAIEDEGLIKIIAGNEDLDEGFTKRHPGLKPGPYVCLTIADDGKGMDEETRSGIFEPFFTTKSQGRGMGMAAVYGIVKNHDGWIYVDSELGKGTVVQIYLPAIEIEVEKPKKAKVEVATGSGTILMIEDEDVVIEVTQAMLEMLGYRVMVAKTGKDAIHIAKTFDGQIDLALLDIKLPDIHGKNLYPLIMKSRSNLKVIVFSGYSIDGPAREILDAGAQDFIQKPFSLATLSEKLKEVLGGNNP